MPLNQYQNLGPKTLFIYLFGAGIFPVMLMIIIYALWWLLNFFGDNNLINPYLDIINSLMPAALSIAVIFLILMLLIANWQYRRFQFKIDDDAFRVRHGILTREEIAIPYRRIETVDIKQSLIYQLLGVSHLTIDMISDDDDSIHEDDADDEILPAIDSHLAENIQHELTRRANIQKMHVHEE